MINPKTIEVRVHTEVRKSQGRSERNSKWQEPVREKWPHSALILDCETTTDQRQTLLFGTFLYCRGPRNHYATVLESIFYADDLDSEVSVSLIEKYCRENSLQPPVSRHNLSNELFLRAIRAESPDRRLSIFHTICPASRRGLLDTTPRRGVVIHDEPVHGRRDRRVT